MRQHIFKILFAASLLVSVAPRAARTQNNLAPDAPGKDAAWKLRIVAG